MTDKQTREQKKNRRENFKNKQLFWQIGRGEREEKLIISIRIKHFIHWPIQYDRRRR